MIVEGNTDVIAVRQSGLEPVVASMGTALTERQLKELGRLCRRLYLCFDADAAGQEATLRGMELATGQGFDVRVVTLPPGLDPADAAEGFEERLEQAESYLGYRVRIEIERAPDRQEAFVRVRELLARFEDSPERQQALRFLSDKLDLPRRSRPGWRRATGQRATAVSPQLLEAGDRRERDALAGCRRPSRSQGDARGADRRSTSTTSCTGACASTWSSSAAPPTTRWSGWSPSSTRAPAPPRSTSAPPSSCCSACASAGSSASLRARTARTCPSCSAAGAGRAAIREFACQARA